MKIKKLSAVFVGAVAAPCVLALSCAQSNMGAPGGDDPGDVAACNDGIDNDGDGLIDFPDDPGCALGLDDSEDDDCPSGDGCPACANGVDDDGDGDIDYPDDAGCASASDGNELNENPASCGGVKLETLTENEVTGTLESSGASGLSSDGCGGSGGEVAYTFAVTRPSSLVISTDFPETEFDTVIYVRSSCGNEDTELGCNDDAADAISNGSTLVLERVEPGEYYVIVDGQFQGAGGQFKLQVTSYIGRDEACTDGVDDCAPGLMCQDPLGGQVTTCVPPRCSDGIDNDGDGLTDYPVEPGCATATANDEVDDCPTGPGCPQCSNGIDDDGDGLIDMGSDIGCAHAGDDDEEDCTLAPEGLSTIDAAETTGDTTDATHDATPSCRSTSTAPELVHRLAVPGELESLTVDTYGSDFDTTIYLRAMSCEAADLACNDDSDDNVQSIITLSDVEAGDYFIFVDGYYSSSNSGPYTLNVSGVIKAGEACDAALDAAGVLSCGGGTSCSGGMCQ
jgi:hypothetical protein